MHKKALEHKTNLLSTNVPRKVLFWKIDSPSLYKLAEKAHLSSQGLRKLFGWRRPAVLLAPVACEVEAVSISAQY